MRRRGRDRGRHRFGSEIYTSGLVALCLDVRDRCHHRAVCDNRDVETANRETRRDEAAFRVSPGDDCGILRLLLLNANFCVLQRSAISAEGITLHA